MCLMMEYGMASFLILIVLIWCDIPTLSAKGEELSWSCNFENDDCSIIQGNDDDGRWTRYSPWLGRKYYYAYFESPWSATDIVKCTLPLGFSATTGRLLFSHYSPKSNIKFQVCSGGAVYILQTTRRTWSRHDRTIDCQSSEIDISFQAVRGNFYQPDLRIDNIIVYGNIPSTTNSPSTSEKPTTKKPDSTVSLWTSTSPSSSYQASIATQTSISDITSVTLLHTTAHAQGAPGKIETTADTPQSTSNPKMPYTGKENRGVEATIISVVVVGILFLAIITAIFVIVLRRRRMKQQNNDTPELRTQTDGNVYTNAAFSAGGVDTDQPDVISDVGFRNHLGSPHRASSLTNPGGSNSHLQEDGYIRYGAENPSAVEQGDYTQLKNLDRSTHHDKNGINGEQEYFVLEDPGERDSERQQCTREPRVAEQQTYDHLNRDNGKTKGHQEYLHENTYCATAVMSDEDHYNTLVRESEAELNPRKRKDMANPKKTAAKGAQDVEDEYQSLRPVDEKEIKRLKNIDENTYNVLGETVDNLDRNEISPNTPENDNTTRDEYHILHSGKELGDYHEYQCPDQPLVSGSTANAVSKAKENEGRDQDDFEECGDGDNNGQLQAEGSSRDAEEQTYDHLNRDHSDVNDQGKGLIQEASSQDKPEDVDHYYSVVNVQGQVGTGDKQHEPLYSSDVYSELA